MKVHSTFLCSFLVVSALSVCGFLTGVTANNEKETAYNDYNDTPPLPSPAISYHATFNASVDNTTIVFTGDEFVDGDETFSFKVTGLYGGLLTSSLYVWGSPTDLPGHYYLFSPDTCKMYVLEYPWNPVFGFLRSAKFEKSDVINGRKCNWWTTDNDLHYVSVCFTEESVPVERKHRNTRGDEHITTTYLSFVPGKQDPSEFSIPSQCKK